MNGFFGRFRRDRRGVAWVLGVAVIGVLLMPIVYFPLSYAWDQLLTYVTDGYVFTGVYANALAVVRIIISYLLAFGLVFIVNWAVVQAKARRYSP